MYGIGPSTANKLYDEGHRTLDDLARRYRGSGISAAVRGGGGGDDGQGRAGGELTMEEALRIRDELQIKSVPFSIYPSSDYTQADRLHFAL